MAARKARRSVRLGPLELELLGQLRECGVGASEAIREAIRAYVPYLLEQCQRRRERQETGGT